MASRVETEDIQWVVRFADQSKVVPLPPHPDGSKTLDATIRSLLLSLWSDRTGWPISFLEVTSWNFPFISVRVKSSIRGGKGGFGTLLKGQSRQAGAKLTTDFGACRDLQGRRLRHVNDEIKLRLWRDMKRREEAGEKVPDDELWKTPSGIYNWHLMTPAWADISKKATHRIKRQFQQMDHQAQKEALKKQEREQVYQNSMTHYLNKATEATEAIQLSIGDAIQQGLAASSKKRKLPIPEHSVIESAEPNSLVTLSGDLVVEESTKEGLQFQSKSDFGTAVLVLDRATTQAAIVYYEVTLVTGGMAQIGWARMLGDKPFSPNNDIGDGVGDDGASYGVDGTRRLKFHAGTEGTYELDWKQGDRLGCWVNTNDGTIGFSINGIDCGTAFELEDKTVTLLPAFSCNEGEILHLHTSQKDCQFFPKGCIAVGDLVVTESSPAVETDEPKKTHTESPAKIPPEKTPSPPQAATPSPKQDIKPEFLDLHIYMSSQELEELGPDRLKAALLALQVKCGGTLSERAARLFSLKGLARKEYPRKVRAQGFVE
jgi:Replication stress response SDE2 C-terminal/Silencing defective 2 N-terminal ubiquitin domain/SPRY domain